MTASVMSRGFDFFNRVFTVEEPPVHNAKGAKTYTSKELAHWDLYSAAKLNWNPFMQADFARNPNAKPPSIAINDDSITLRAPAGIRVWGADTDDLTPVFTEYLDEAPTELKVSKKLLREKLGAKETFRLTLIDSNGRQVGENVKP